MVFISKGVLYSWLILIVDLFMAAEVVPIFCIVDSLI